MPQLGGYPVSCWILGNITAKIAPAHKGLRPQSPLALSQGLPIQRVLAAPRFALSTILSHNARAFNYARRSKIPAGGNQFEIEARRCLPGPVCGGVLDAGRRRAVSRLSSEGDSHHRAVHPGHRDRYSRAHIGPEVERAL